MVVRATVAEVDRDDHNATISESAMVDRVGVAVAHGPHAAMDVNHDRGRMCCGRRAMDSREQILAVRATTPDPLR
jgi:hypothetical protein